jgi:hypothetical protein
LGNQLTQATSDTRHKTNANKKQNTYRWAINKGNNKITELRAILHRPHQ